MNNARENPSVGPSDKADEPPIWRDMSPKELAEMAKELQAEVKAIKKFLASGKPTWVVLAPGGQIERSHSGHMAFAI